MANKYCKFNDDEHIEFCFSGQIPDKCENKECYMHKMKWYHIHQWINGISLFILLISGAASPVFDFPYLTLAMISVSLGVFLSFGSLSRLNRFTSALCEAYKSDNFSGYMIRYIIKHIFYAIICAAIIMVLLVLAKFFLIPIIKH